MSGVNDSKFYMWRTLFAIAHADCVVSDEEVRFMSEALEDVPFSPDQYAVLKQDIMQAQDIEKMFLGITDVQDQAVFFKYARELCHIDGDYSAEEQAIMLKLKSLHIGSVDIDSLAETNMGIEFDYDLPSKPKDDRTAHVEGVFASFKALFVGR